MYYESPEERKLRLARERQKRWRDRQQNNALRLFEQNTEYKHLGRIKEEPEDAQARKVRCAYQSRQRRAIQSEEEAAARRKRAAEQVRQSRAIRQAQETEAQAAARRQREADRVRQRRARRLAQETEEQAAERRRRESDRVRQRRARQKAQQSEAARDQQVYCNKQQIENPQLPVI